MWIAGVDLDAAAELVSDFKAGVHWVELASLTDPLFAPDAIAGTLQP